MADIRAIKEPADRMTVDTLKWMIGEFESSDHAGRVHIHFERDTEESPLLVVIAAEADCSSTNMKQQNT